MHLPSELERSDFIDRWGVRLWTIDNVLSLTKALQYLASVGGGVQAAVGC